MPKTLFVGKIIQLQNDEAIRRELARLEDLQINTSSEVAVYTATKLVKRVPKMRICFFVSSRNLH